MTLVWNHRRSPKRDRPRSPSVPGPVAEREELPGGAVSFGALPLGFLECEEWWKWYGLFTSLEYVDFFFLHSVKMIQKQRFLDQISWISGWFLAILGCLKRLKRSGNWDTRASRNSWICDLHHRCCQLRLAPSVVWENIQGTQFFQPSLLSKRHVFLPQQNETRSAGSPVPNDVRECRGMHRC